MTALPPLLVLTDRRACERRGRTLAETVEAAVAGGARALVLREKDLPHERRRELGEILAGLLSAAKGVLIVASDPVLAEELGAVWVHLADADPWPGGAAGSGRDRGRPHGAGPRRQRFGRSCHDALSLRRARDGGAAYATLSPIFSSVSKPGYGPPLGLAGLARLARTVPDLPVHALGGVDAGTASDCRAAGAAGVAVMGAVMGAADPEGATQALVAAVGGGPAG
ncbi:MAG: thiamine phosphate synthase [Candidatus Dormibacteria bacterium]